MRFSHFFIRRPIFASVLSIVLLIVGGIAYFNLPVAQYPEIAPPTIVVRTSYPGADSQTIADTVATPIEQEINGVEDMLYMSSYSSADGAMSITVTFKLGRTSIRRRCWFRTALRLPNPGFRKTCGVSA
jgi:hydrophobic/amphiphilic exporter-1 (mainly G- bacteria), HAE1 family